MSVNEKLMKIQTEIKAPKNLRNTFGNYNYRNAEGIFEAVKPYLAKNNCSLTVEDSIEAYGDRVYVKATATLTDNEKGDSVSVSAYAREAAQKKGMDDSQVTGATSSYARKYALNGLFLLDDTKDTDTDEYRKESESKKKQTETEEKFEKVGKELVTKDDVKALTERCKNDGVDTEKLCSLYKVKELAMLTVNQLSNIINNWDKVKESAAA